MGIRSLPAGTSSAAQQLVDELRVDAELVIANLGVAGTVELIKLLRRANPALKVIAIEDGTPIARPFAIDAVHPRSEADWLATVERVLNLRNASRAS